MKVIEVPIDSIMQDTANARSHGKQNMDAIKGSIAKFGQVEPLVVNKKTKVIIGGNGRHAAMKELGYEKVKIVELDVTATEATALGLALNRTAELAEWNEDVLGQLLHSLREDNFDLGEIGFDASYLDNLFDENNSTEGEENIYTKKIDTPIYTPTGEKPELKDLFDISKTKQLVEKINKSNTPPQIKEFLISAAQRHTVFNYQNIAEFYAHSDKEVQELFEESALVIIDFKKAIEYGFVKMTKAIEDFIHE